LLLAGLSGFWYWLNRFAYLPGTDAYYYALQAQSILQTGYLKVPGNGALYYAIAFVAWAGASMETAFRIVLSAVFALAILAIWSHAAQLRRNVRLFAVMLVLGAAPVIAFHTVEFPRLTLALAAIPILLRLAATGQALGSPLLWLVVVTSSLLHPLLAVLDVLFVGGLLLTAWWVRWRETSGIPRSTIVLSALGAAVFAMVMLTAWPGLGLRITSMSLGTPGLLALCLAPGVPADIKASVLLLWLLLAGVSILYIARGRSRYRYAPLAVLGLALWPDAGNSLAGTGVRLSLAFVFIALPVMFVILEQWKWSEIGPLPWRARVLRGGVSVAVLLLLTAIPFRVGAYHKLLLANDYDQYAKVVAFAQGRDIPMLTARRGLDFYYSYRLRRDAFHFDPETEWKQSAVWRVAMRVTPEELVFYAPAACLWGSTAMQIRGTALLFVREDCWERFRTRLSPRDNPDLYQQVWRDAENPAEKRPAYLRSKYRRVADVANTEFAVSQ